MAVYYLIVGFLSRDWGYPVEQFVRLQPWMSLVVGGFGVQLGLLSYLRQGGKMMAGTGAGSGLAMAACCAHHASEIAPFLGMAGVSVFLTEYQKELLMMGVVANGIGIGINLGKLRWG